jgi:hypothetical protein
MQEESMARRVPDLGGPASFAGAPRHQASLDVQAEAELVSRARPCRPGGGPP